MLSVTYKLIVLNVIMLSFFILGVVALFMLSVMGAAQ
jgi:hypothetical protein